MKKIWFLGLLLAANLAYAQTSIQKHFFHCTQKDSVTLYLWEDFTLQQTVEFPDTFYCDGRYFFPHDSVKRVKTAVRSYSKVIDSMSIQGVPYKNGRMLKAVLDVVRSRMSHVVYGRSKSLYSYGVVWAITTTSYICEYDHVAKTVHFSHSDTTIYAWKRATALMGAIFLFLIGIGWVMRKDKKIDYLAFLVFLVCSILLFLITQMLLTKATPLSNPFLSSTGLAVCAFFVLKMSHAFFKNCLRSKQ